ncbi:MAG: hypothetical protein AABP62_22135 [Planctomycetota bacterium]
MPTDPLTLLFIAGCTAIVGVVSPILAEYAKARFSQHTLISSLKAEKTEAENRAMKAESERAAAQAKNAEQQAKYDARFSDEAIRSKYTFNKSTATFTLGGDHFCHPCLFKSPPLESPLHPFGDGWTCGCCGQFHKAGVRATIGGCG